MKWPAIIIGLVAVFVLIVSLRTGLVGDCIGVVGFVWYALLPFIDRKRARARWASYAILFSGLLGVAMATVSLLRHSGILLVSSQTSHAIAHYRLVVCGVILGVIFLLFISGQMLGIKHEIRDEPTA